MAECEPEHRDCHTWLDVPFIVALAAIQWSKSELCILRRSKRTPTIRAWIKELQDAGLSGLTINNKCSLLSEEEADRMVGM